MNKKQVISQAVKSLISIADELDKSQQYSEADLLTKVASNLIAKTRTAAPYNGYNQSLPADELGQDPSRQFGNFNRSMNSDEYNDWADESPNAPKIFNQMDRIQTDNENNPGYGMSGNPHVSGGYPGYGAEDFDGDEDDNWEETQDPDYRERNGYDELENPDPFTRGQQRVDMSEADNDPNSQYFK